MKHTSYVIVSFLTAMALFGAQAAHAGTPAGEVTQLSGFVMAVKANGALKVLSPQSVVEAGDTLVSEENTYVRIGLADGRQAVLGPQTRLEFTSASRLNLTTGQLQVLAAAQLGSGTLTIAAGDTTVDAGTASFNLLYRPDPAIALARRAYAQASLAWLASPVQSDAGTAIPLRELVATYFTAEYVGAGGPVPPSKSVPSNPSSSGPVLPPGLYVHVLDGAIVIANSGGSQIFAAGQFGYTTSFAQPPVALPTNPGLSFAPPPSFSASTAPGGKPASGTSGTVNCEVR